MKSVRGSRFLELSFKNRHAVDMTRLFAAERAWCASLRLTIQRQSPALDAQSGFIELHTRACLARRPTRQRDTRACLAQRAACELDTPACLARRATCELDAPACLARH